MSDPAATHDAVLFFSKSWGALYLGVVFIAAVIWIYRPSKKAEMDRAARSPLEEEDRPCR
ncbi:MAG: cbb3-type cytochrome c oxidase subunit 3 [Pseudomonadota bacterium]